MPVGLCCGERGCRLGGRVGRRSAGPLDVRYFARDTLGAHGPFLRALEECLRRGVGGMLELGGRMGRRSAGPLGRYAGHAVGRRRV